VTAPVYRNVTLSIAGRSQVISLAAEEEDHVRMLARMVEDRVRRLGVTTGQTEARMLLIAALTLADEVHAADLAARAAAAEAAAEAAAAAAAPPPPPPPSPEIIAEIPAFVLERVATLAERVEKLAARLEQSGIEP
jgi:cell division protein ZapA